VGLRDTATVGTFDRTIARMLNHLPRRRTAFWYEDKLHCATDDESRSRAGRRFNKLVRFAGNVGSARVNGFGDRRLGNT
jgi:hypothetical protein